MGNKRKATAKDTDAEVVDGEAPPAKKLQQRRSLFVHSLAATTTTESLIEHFSQSFPVKHATAVTDPSTKTCKGYGFVTFADADDAKKALEEFNGTTLLGRKIKAEIAEPRSRDVDDTIPAEISGGVVEQRKAAVIEKRAKKEQERKELLRPPKLIVRNLPWSIKKPEQLTKLFLSYGKIKSAVIPEKKGGLSSGFGFVVLRGKKNAERAIAGVNGKEIDGRTLAVDYAVEKEVWEKQQNITDGEGREGDEADAAMSGQAREDGSDMDDDEDGGIALDNSDDDASDRDSADDFDEVEEGAKQQDSDDENDDLEDEEPKEEDYTPTLFIRNLPFTTTEDELRTHFTQFGPVRYARTVLDPTTERSRGTAFVCFVKPEDAQSCLREAPAAARATQKPSETHSTLQNELDDPSGRYTIAGRVLSITRAVSRNESSRLASTAKLGREEKDKRRAYLLSEGTIPHHTALYSQLSDVEVAMREASLKQRKTLIQNNPSLNLSLTRLSVRNIPRSVDSKQLKSLAREAVVGFATDVKAGKRERLSKEELARGGAEMLEAEKRRKKKGKGVVKQTKVVFEGREGGKVDEASGAGRSRGYGFVEFHTHRAALMGLRWLNGHSVGYEVTDKGGKGKNSRDELVEKKKRLIVEFAIENAQVVRRRTDREVKARAGVPSARAATGSNTEALSEVEAVNGQKNGRSAKAKPIGNFEEIEDERQAKRQRIINFKRAKRRGNRRAAKG